MEDEIDLFMHKVGMKLKKKPEAMQTFIDKLKDNWYDNLDSLKEIDDDTWNNVLKFPSRLVKIIKDELNTGDEFDEEMIDTSTKKTEPTYRDTHMADNDDQEQSPPIQPSKVKKTEELKGNDPSMCAFSSFLILNLDDITLLAKEYLRDFYKETNDDSGVIWKSLKTLTKVLQNVIASPMEPKYRSLDTTKKAVQEKISNFKGLVSFLVLCGFEVKESEMILKGYPGDKLNKALDAIFAELKDNSEKFGVTVKSNFDPYAEGIVSTTGNKLSSGATKDSQYNPSHIDKMMAEERKLKKTLMERKIEDRETQVFNSLSGTTDIKKVMRAYEEENIKEAEDYEESLRQTGALKLLGENAKNQKFNNKRLQEYEKLRNQKVYSTTILRVKFPDGLILQGKFGSREKLENVYEFVLDNILDKERPFYLFKAPPKKVLTGYKKDTLKKIDLVPSGMVYFQWEDEDLATSSKLAEKEDKSGIVLDVNKLKDKFKNF